MITRRTFVAGAAAALTAAPHVAWGQQRVDPIRLAVMSSSFTHEEISESGAQRFQALFGELRRLGLVEGEGLIVGRWSNAGRPEADLPDLARQMVANQPDIIFAHGTSDTVTVASATATATIPVIFVAADPIGNGFGESLHRPGGNMTGFATGSGTDVHVKRLQLLREIVPGVEPIAILVTPRVWETSAVTAGIRRGAAQIGITLVPAFVEGVVDEQSIARAFAALPEWPNRVMFVSGAGVFAAHDRAIAAAALRANIPTVSGSRSRVKAGLLMSYSFDLNEQYRGAAGYIARVAGGEDPAEMPIQQPTKYNFIVNLRTARALGLTIPPEIMLRATEVIE